MKKIVEITALIDRPTLAIKKGEKLRLELEGDSLVMLENEVIKGLIEYKEIEKK